MPLPGRARCRRGERQGITLDASKRRDDQGRMALAGARSPGLHSPSPPPPPAGPVPDQARAWRPRAAPAMTGCITARDAGLHRCFAAAKPVSRPPIGAARAEFIACDGVQAQPDRRPGSRRADKGPMWRRKRLAGQLGASSESCRYMHPPERPRQGDLIVDRMNHRQQMLQGQAPGAAADRAGGAGALRKADAGTEDDGRPPVPARVAPSAARL